MNKKFALIATALCCVVALGVIGTSAIAKIDPSAKLAKLAELEAEFAAKQKKFYEMSNQTKEEQDAVVAEGKRLKQLDIEKEKLRRETDPDDEAHFLVQLDSYILGMGTGVVELKARAEREQNPEFLKQAEKIKKEIEKFEKEKQAYLNGEKTVKELRKELDLPVDNL
ncbi:hypothetical protein [Paenibacillus oleatilyticus]|uniref:hypothetical protein n=1 Tax=Paenibacillus oleatilyticus TaxID=2594886 RepID=UPI001C1FFB19|nr:hypothetical protein [Paenibacillus oleatilyticus]MBU7318269.1 hypothetical protein [Paenibacillus oleatilyticus]